MKKLLCLLSAFAVLIISGCSSKPSEAPLFEKYVAEGTNYPVKMVWHEKIMWYDKSDSLSEDEITDSVSTYYIASPDTFCISYALDEGTIDALYKDGVMYNISHDEKTAFASPSPSDRISIGYIPAEPEKWTLIEKGEAQYDGKTLLYETAALEDTYFLTVYADPATRDIKYVSYGQGGPMVEFVEMTHSFDLRVFDIPEDYDIVRMP